MYRRILVPLDGSSLAERALPYAQHLAKVSGARLHLVRAVPPVRFPDEQRREERLKAMSDAEEYLAGLSLVAAGAGNVETSAYYDDAAVTIVEETRLRPVDLIVMSTHGRAGLGRVIYGSVAEQVFRHVQVPTLIVSPTSERPWSTEPSSRVLVPLDGSDLAADALAPAAELATSLGADLLLLRVIHPMTITHVAGYPEPVAVPTSGIGPGEAEDELVQAAAPLRAQGHRVTTEVVEGTDVPAAIAATARERKASAIAMSTHGHSGVARLVMGSVAAGIIQKADVPILLVRPTAMHRNGATPQMVHSGDAR